MSSADVNKLLAGFQPRQMEDRWCCCAETTGQQSIWMVRFYRSWTGDEQLAIRVKTGMDDGDGKHGGEITAITWDEGEASNPVAEDDAKELVRDLCEGLLQLDCSMSTE